MPEEKFNPFKEEKQRQKAAEIEQGAYDALNEDFGSFAAGTVDKVARVISGSADFLSKAVTSAPEALAYWTASKFFDDDELDSPEERKALMAAVTNVTKLASPNNYALESITDGIVEELNPFIDKHEGKDFVDLAEEGSYLEAADAFVGDVASALPSVGAAFLGPGGLALIGSSAFGGKFEEQLENDTEATSDALLLNAASSAGGEILSEAFTAGLGGGLTKLAKKLGPKAAKAILRNTGSKLAFSFTGEGLSEVAAEAWDKAGDYKLLGDEKAFEGALRDFGKTFLLGGAIGGGIATAELANPAVKQSVENYIQPDKIKESQKESAGKINALEAQLYDAQVNGDDLLADAIQDEIRYERKRLKNSKDKVSDQASNLSPEQVLELKEINDKLTTFKELQEEGGYDDAGQAVLREQITKLEAKQENIFENASFKDATKKEPVLEANRKKSQAIQQAYERGDNPATIVEQFEGAVRNTAYKLWKPDLYQGSIDHFISDLKYERGGVESLIKSYKKDSTVPLAAYVQGQLPKRAKRIVSKYYKGKQDTNIADITEQGTTDKFKLNPKILVENLGLKAGIITKAQDAAKAFQAKLGDVKKPKDFDKTQKKHFTDALQKEVQGILRPKGVSIKEKAANYKQFVNNNKDVLNSLYERGERTSQETADFVNGLDLDLNTPEGKKAHTKRQEQVEAKIGETLGRLAWQEYLDSNPDALKEYNARMTIKENRTAESIKPGTTTDYAFQEDTQPAEDDFAAQSKATNKVLEDNGVDKLPDSKDPKQYEEMRGWIAETMSGYFPRSFFTSGQFWNAGTSAAKRGFFATTEADFNELTDGYKFNSKGDEIFSKAQRYLYKKHSVDKLIADKARIKERNEANQAAFNEMWKRFDQMIKDDKNNARFIAAFLKSAQNSQNHLSRTGAPLVAYSKTGPYTEEHAMPQSAVSRYLLNTLLSGGDINSALKNTNKNFVQVALNTTDDASLKQNKIGPKGSNLNSNMPAGWKPSDNWLARYFNNTSKIDPNSIVFLDSGKTVTEAYIPKEFSRKELGLPPYGDFSGTRAGAEFRIKESLAIHGVMARQRRQAVADAVADQTPRQISKALADLYNYATLNTSQSKDELTGVISVLRRSWGKRGVDVTTNPKEAREAMIAEGFDPAYVDEVLGRANGFAYGGFIYVDPNVSPEVPIHEFGHIWNHILQQENPEAFNTIFDKVRNEAPEVFYQQLERIRKYKLEINSPEWKDEIMAGIIGYHGQAKIGTKSTDQSIRQIIKEFYQAIKKLIGFDFKGKNLEDLNVEQMLDLIVDEVATGNPGKNFKQLNNESWVKSNKAKRGIAFSLKGDPQYDGLKAVKDNYRETKDLQAALEAGYQKVKDRFDKDTWLEFAGKAVSKIEGANALSIIKGKILEQNDVSLDKIQQSKDIKTRFDTVLKNTGKEGKPSKWIVPPNTEDFKGLLYTLVQGNADKQFILDTLLKPYDQAIDAARREQLALMDAISGFKNQGVDFNKEVTPDYNLGDAIRVYNMVQDGDATGLDPDVEADLIAAVEAGNVDIANTIKEQFNLTDNWQDSNLYQSLNDFVNRDTRQKYLDQSGWIENVDALINNRESYRQLKQQFGQEYVDAMKNIIARMKRGSNSKGKGGPIVNWLNRSVGSIMFLNMRSGILQMISSLNFIGLPNNGFGAASKAFLNQPQYWKDVTELLKSDYLKDRFKGAKFDVLADEIDRIKDKNPNKVGKAIDKLLKKGFVVTRAVDSFAIASGGATFYRNRIDALMKEGMTEADAKAQATEEWISQAEEVQQSADPSKVSQIQSGDAGKLIFAFANTPFQYMRKAKRHYQDIANGRSKNPSKDAATIFYYTAGSTAIFTSLQTGLAMLAFGDDDEAKDEKFWTAIDRSITSLTKSMGYYGLATGTGYSLVRELYEQKDRPRKDKLRILMTLLSASPPVSSKAWDAVAATSALEQKKYVKAVAEGTTLITGAPADRVFKKLDNLVAMGNNDIEMWERVFRLMGWSEHDFKSHPKYGGRKKKGPFDSKNPFKEKNPFKGKESPFDRGEDGQAFKDGTIEVDPNLPPEEKAKTIQHEMQHQHDMEAGILDYDENNVYYQDSAFKRKGGKIHYNGQWVEEGHPSLPWESRAFEAEEDYGPQEASGDDIVHLGKQDDVVMGGRADLGALKYLIEKGYDKGKELYNKYKG